MNKLPSRHFHLVFSVLMGTTMVTLVTLIVTLVNVGPVPDFLSRWGRAFAIAWWVAVPVLYLLGPRVRRFTGRLVHASDGISTAERRDLAAADPTQG